MNTATGELMQRLKGMTAIVTGASRGIGAGIAQAFAADGAAVALVARTRNASSSSEPGTLEDVAATIEADGGRACVIVADLLDASAPPRIVAEAEASLGPIDILVNNALISTMESLETIDPQAVRDMFEGQVIAPLALSQLVIPGMRERGRGWIINLTSKGSRRPPGPPFSWGIRGGTSGYGSVKAAVERMTVGFAGETHGSGIAVNALGPSRIVRTPGVRKGAWGNVAAENYEDPATIAEAAVLLASCDPETFTGKIVWSEELPHELTGG